MCRKLLFLIALLGLVGTAWADDTYPPSWRDDPGTTYSEWSYDADAPNPVTVPRFDIPDIYSFVPHPDKIDPEWVQQIYEEDFEGDYPGYGPFGDAFSWQLWAAGSGIDPGPPIWMPTYVGRTGVMADFAMGSWDLNNFIHDQPLKDMYVQLTYFTGSEIPVDFTYELEYPTGEFEYYWEEGEWVEQEVWVFEAGDVEFIENSLLGDGWMYARFELALAPNPSVEFLGLFPDIPITLDHIIIDTYCVPEPATIALLGLGGLALLRRKRR